MVITHPFTTLNSDSPTATEFLLEAISVGWVGIVGVGEPTGLADESL